MGAKVTGRYEYRDASGQLIYWKERIEPGRNGQRKEFIFYHSSRSYGRGDTGPILYNLPNVVNAKSVIFTEGEKQADLINSWGLVATTLDSGANSKIPAEMVVPYLAGKRVAILRDNDEPGLKYAENIAGAIHRAAEMVKIVLLPGLPEKGDICDWATGERCQLLELIKQAGIWIAPPPPPVKPVKVWTGTMEGKISPEMIHAANQFPIDQLIDFTRGKSTCFVHEEKTPSLNHHAAKNRAKCFGCGMRFSPIDVLIHRDGFSFPDAVRQLAGAS